VWFGGIHIEVPKYFSILLHRLSSRPHSRDEM
jgi:hypothetical protein